MSTGTIATTIPIAVTTIAIGLTTISTALTTISTAVTTISNYVIIYLKSFLNSISSGVSEVMQKS